MPAPEPQFIETTDLPPSGELPPGGMQENQIGEPASAPVLTPDHALGSLRGNQIGEPASAPVLTGSQTKDEIRVVMQRNQVRYGDCYERELLKTPSLAGTIVMEFVVRADGAVASASVASTTIGSPAVEQCIADAVKQLVFPPPRGGGILKVSYPLVFRRQ